MGTYNMDDVPDLTTSINVFELENAISVAFDRTAVWTISKYMVRRLGAIETILVLELGEKEAHNITTISRKEIEETTSFSQRTQEIAETTLIGLGIITVKKTEDPMVNTYEFNHDVLNAILEGK